METVPLSIAALHHVVVLVAPDRSLIAIDRHTRRMRWRLLASETGVAARQVVPYDGGTLVVLSGANDPVLHVDGNSGEILKRWPPPTRALIQTACRMSVGLFMMVALEEGQSLWLIDRHGMIRVRAPLPWRELDRAHPLQRQVAAASNDGKGRCALMLLAGGGFALLDRRAATLRGYVEPVHIGAVTVRTTALTYGRRTESVFHGSFPVTEGAMTDDLLFVPFGGPRPIGSLLDVYGVSDGSYKFSIQVTSLVRRIIASHRELLIATYERGIPTLSASSVP